MKWIVALLMIVNVAVYLWANQHQDIVGETVISPKFDVNKDGMLMLSEMGDLKQIGRITGRTDDSISSTYDVATPTESIQGSSLDTPQVATSCYQLGPFKKQKSWQAATRWMTENGIEFRHVTSASRELQAVRVYLGPYQTISSTEPIVRLLKSKNLNHFIYPVENDSFRISLGYFTQQELAEKFLTHLHAINVEANSQFEYRQLGPFNWLVIPIGGTKEKQVINHDWAESVMRLSQIGC